MTDLSERETLKIQTRRVLEDMTSIRRTLLNAAEQASGGRRSARPPLDLELAIELKCAVDALRKLLWEYIHAIANESVSSPGEILSLYKMDLAADLLRVAAATNGAQAPDGSDLDRIIAAASNASERRAVGPKH